MNVLTTQNGATEYNKTHHVLRKKKARFNKRSFFKRFIIKNVPLYSLTEQKEIFRILDSLPNKEQRTKELAEKF